MLNLNVRLMKLHFLLPFVFFLLAAQESPADCDHFACAAGDFTRPGHDHWQSGCSELRLRSTSDFAYASNPTDTWFTIQTFSQPLADSTLATWDTTSITDGDYVLRLRVNFADGTLQDVTVPIKIGNDFVPTPTPEPTSTPEADSVLIPTPFLLAASPTPTDVPRPTPTALPSNPVSLGQNQIYVSLGRGALVILGLFALAGIIIRVRHY